MADRSEGTRRIYYIDPKGLGAMRAWLDQILGSGARTLSPRKPSAAPEKENE